MSKYSKSEKFYRFFNLRNAYFYNKREQKRTEFICITVEAVISEKIPPTFTTLPSGKMQCNFEIAIPNRGKYIKSYCGLWPYETEENGDMVTWARVSAFGGIASRFSNFVATHPNCSIVLCGRINVEEVTKNGVTYVNTNILMDDFILLHDNKKPAANAASLPASDSDCSEEPVASYSGGITDFDPDLDLDEEDEDLPF